MRRSIPSARAGRPPLAPPSLSRASVTEVERAGVPPRAAIAALLGRVDIARRAGVPPWMLRLRAPAAAVAAALGFAAVLWVIGLIANGDSAFPRRLHDNPAGALGMWTHWDWGWYSLIVGQGYGVASHVLGPGNAYVDGTAFSPGFPIAIVAVRGALHIPALSAALLLNAVCLPAVILFLYRLAELDHGPRVAALSVFLQLSWPAAVFLVAPYPESLLLACTVGAFLLARRRRWLLAGLALGAATAVKMPSPLIVGVPLAVELVEAGGWRSLAQLRRLALLWVPAVAVVAAWMTYLGVALGNPVRFLQAQSGWHHVLTPIWTPIISESRALVTLQMFDDPDGLLRVMDLFSILFLGVMAVYLFARVRRSYGVMIGLSFLAFGSEGVLGSIGRYVIESFPVFIGLAVLCVRRGWLERAITLTWLPGLAYLTARFTAGRWAG